VFIVMTASILNDGKRMSAEKRSKSLFHPSSSKEGVVVRS